MYNFRPRTTYTNQQKEVLEHFYQNETTTPKYTQRVELGKQLDKDPNVIYVRINVSF